MSNIKGWIDGLIGEAKFPESQKKRLWKLAEGIDPQVTHPTKPKKFSLKVNQKNTGETAAQRAIYNAEYAKIADGRNITWIDIELPVVFSGKGRRPCLDIIGKDDDENYYLVELKYGKTGNNPIYALLELLCYYLIIGKNASELNAYKVWRPDSKFSWDSFGNDKTILIVAANEEYWAKYKKESSYSLKKSKSFFDKIESEIKVKIQFFSFANLAPAPDNIAKSYEPELLDNNKCWEEIRLS